MHITEHIMGYRSFQTRYDIGEEFSHVVWQKKMKKNDFKGMTLKRGKGEEFLKKLKLLCNKKGIKCM